MKPIDKNEIYHRFFDGGNGIATIHVADIDEIPQLNVAPVVHGRWNVNGINPHNGTVGNYHCSVCDKVSLEDSSYCPNCGAKMDFEEEQ